MKNCKVNLMAWAFCSLLFFLCVVFPVAASDAVTPAQLTMNSIRDEVVGYPTDVSYFEGSTLLLTNCVMYAGTTTNSAKQGLVDVTIQVKIGTATTNQTYSGTVQVASNGTWTCTASVPTNSGQCYLQVKITDVNTNSYIYPWKILNHKSAL